ncbi:MAG: hypothetical protein E5V75_23985 [Mesorhizobium sp.]|nr:MAG: hypothetical protein E5V75_23985 [Mesorhizobium sp.]
MKTSEWVPAAATIAAGLFAAWSAYSSATISATSATISSTMKAESEERIALLQKTYQDRQLDIEMVKLALNILGGETSDHTQQSRQFAINLLEKYSGVEIGDKAKQAWVTTGTVAFKDSTAGLAPAGDLSKFWAKSFFEQQMINPR